MVKKEFMLVLLCLNVPSCWATISDDAHLLTDAVAAAPQSQVMIEGSGFDFDVVPDTKTCHNCSYPCEMCLEWCSTFEANQRSATLCGMALFVLDKLALLGLL